MVFFIVWGLRYKNLNIVAGPHVLHTQLLPAPALSYTPKIQAVVQIECPLCGIVCDPGRIIENQFLLELANNEETAKNTEMKCSNCTDDAAATSYCTDCSEFICDNCVQAHQRLKITKDHTIKPKEDGLMELNSVTNGGPASLFC
ncbi:hypothetical protein JTB14_030509 [Gonioctena quinquepunctata]|nr:hypothetical protein JTB14_030509 [Gonioctena quinquepunctata]